MTAEEGNAKLRYPALQVFRAQCMRYLILTTTLLLCGTLALSALAEAPPGYYAGVNRNTPEDLRQTLHELIDDHTIYPLESEDEVDIWDILQLADENIDNPNHVITVFRNASYPKRDAPDLEVVFDYGWPKQYGFPNYEEGNIPYTDGHNMFIADQQYTSARNGWLVAGCTSSCTERPTEVNNGRGGGSGEYPGNSNWNLVQGNNGLWQVWNGRKGDIARAIFYTEIRYEGGVHTPTGFPEPQFNFPGNFRPDALIDRTRSGENEEEGFFGNKSAALAWHSEDPPDAIEQQHQDTVFAFQGNRNPFIDHPEWVACLHLNQCTPFQINGGLSDAWYDPETAGQGFLITVLPSSQLMFVAMFTYDVERPDESVTAVIGEPGHRYVTAVGPYQGSTATLIIEKTTGGTFGEGSPPVDQATDGSMTVEFGGCDNGTVRYDIPSIGRQGEIPIRRVVKDNVALCEAIEASAE
jgi:hypothetical protein